MFLIATLIEAGARLCSWAPFLVGACALAAWGWPRRGWRVAGALLVGASLLALHLSWERGLEARYRFLERVLTQNLAHAVEEDAATGALPETGTVRIPLTRARLEGWAAATGLPPAATLDPRRPGVVEDLIDWDGPRYLTGDAVRWPEGWTAESHDYRLVITDGRLVALERRDATATSQGWLEARRRVPRGRAP